MAKYISEVPPKTVAPEEVAETLTRLYSSYPNHKDVVQKRTVP